MLRDSETGVPVFYPNLYVVTQLRQTNKATATITRSLREIMVLLDFLAIHGIDLADRIRAGHLLSLGEIEGLTRHCRQKFRQVDLRRQVASDDKMMARTDSRLKAQRLRAEVGLLSSENRIRTIHSYLQWLVSLHLYQDGLAEDVKSSLANIQIGLLPMLLARVPREMGRNSIGRRQGVKNETMERIIEIVDQDSLENPWKRKFTRGRNELIVGWLRELGLRRGELLNVKITDIDFRENTLVVARRADDPGDTRTDQPLVKTRDRKLPLSPELAAATYHYIVNYRSRLPGARKHPFLIVAANSGSPLSLSAFNKLFRVLRTKCPDLPAGLTAHVVRHTWNDEFTAEMEEAGISDEMAEKMRSYIMGWSPTSKTASTCTRRGIEERARKASLDMQSKMVAGRKEKK